jgi:hypothetical protein
MPLPNAIRLPTNGSQSGRGQPHSKTLSRRIARYGVREALECGCPLPLLLPVFTSTVPFVGLCAAPFWSFLHSPHLGGYSHDEHASDS